MKIRIASILLCFVMAVSILTGCGASTEQTVTEVESTSEQTVSNDDSGKVDSGKENKSTEKKKIVIVQESDVPVLVEKEGKIIATLEKNGYVNGQTAEIIEIKLAGDANASEGAVKQINELKPDVVIMNSVSFSMKAVAKALAGSGIPTIGDMDIANKAYDFIDENGKPKQNVTGIYTMPKDLQVNAFRLFQKIVPTDGKKAVFLTTEGFFKKEDVEKNLKDVGVELKEYCESKYVEDFQDAVNKYNADSEVAWILVGVWPSMKKDGTSQTTGDTALWDISNRKKPSVTYWASAVDRGILCALGVDLTEVAVQATEMAVKVLGGEKVENINAVYPRKTNIVLNQKRAQDLKIEFPSDILGSATKVYTETMLDKK